MEKKVLCAFASAGLLASSMAFADVTLDDFSTPQAEVEDTTPGNGPETGASVSVGGGQRTLAVDLKSQDVVGRDVRAEVAGGVYSLSNDSGAFGDGTITWTGLNLDLKFQDKIELDIVRIDETAAGTPVTVTLNTGGGNASMTKGATGAGTLMFDFGTAAGVDTAQVTGLVVLVEGSVDNGVDMDLDLVRASGPGRCEITGKEDLSADDPDCKLDFCPIPGAPPDMLADDPLCVPCQFDSSILASDPACAPPPPAVPGITTYGLIGSLLGLPLIAGFFAARRRMKK